LDISSDLKDAVKKIIERYLREDRCRCLKLPVNISARHVHLCPEHIEFLFGKNHSLTPVRDLMQPGEFAAKEQVIMVGPKGILQNVRVLGPPRKTTQVEISRTDAYTLGLTPPVRDSGNHEGTPGCILVGAMGGLKIERGVILAERHIHMPQDLAEKMGLKDRQMVKVRTDGERKVIFDNVLLRVSPRSVPEMHVDTDEANAAGIENGDMVCLIV